jgi:hypothetical protein
VQDLVARHAGLLELHIPPAGERASWYYPGGTLPMLLTRPGITEIVRPTEDEMAAMAAAFNAHHKQQRRRATSTIAAH